MARSDICPNSLPGDGRGPHSKQLQSLLEGRHPECVAARPETWAQRAVDILVG